MDTSIDTSPRKTVKIIGRKPTIKLFNEKHNVATVNTQPPVTPRTRRHYQQNKLKETKKRTPKAAKFAKVRHKAPLKSKIKVGVCGWYGGEPNVSAKNSGVNGSKYLSYSALERRRTERKHISEDNLFYGAREDRAFKERKNHRMHYKESGDQLVRCSPNARAARPKMNVGLKCWSPGDKRIAPFGVDTHVPRPSTSGKRTAPQSFHSTKNILC